MGIQEFRVRRDPDFFIKKAAVQMFCTAAHINSVIHNIFENLYGIGGSALADLVSAAP